MRMSGGILPRRPSLHGRPHPGAAIRPPATVPSARPRAGGPIEWWQTDRRGRYGDGHRGIQTVPPDGAYRFSTDFPGVYPGRPPHIHFKAAAPGYRPLTTQLYLRGGESEVEFDIVLVPAE